MVRTVQTTRPEPADGVNRAPGFHAKTAFTKSGRRKNGFSPLPTVDAPGRRRDAGKPNQWLPDVTNFFKDAWRDLSEIGKEASTFGQGIMGIAVQELTEVGRELSSFSMDVVSDLRETTMELREMTTELRQISMDAPEQFQQSSKELPDVIRNLLPTTMDCSGGCGEQLDLTVVSTADNVSVSEETSSQAAVTFQTSPRARWIAGINHAKVSHASTYKDFTKAAGPLQHGNGATVTTSHYKEPCDADFEEFAKETAHVQKTLHKQTGDHHGTRRDTVVDCTIGDKFWWARPPVSFVDRGASSWSQSSSTCAGESPAPSARGSSPLYSPIQTPRDPRTLVNWDMTGNALSGAWESIDTNNALNAASPL